MITFLKFVAPGWIFSFFIALNYQFQNEFLDWKYFVALSFVWLFIFNLFPSNGIIFKWLVRNGMINPSPSIVGRYDNSPILQRFDFFSRALIYSWITFTIWNNATHTLSSQIMLIIGIVWIFLFWNLHPTSRFVKWLVHHRPIT
ncbi:hypothetical protein ABM34_09645 [Companilactobacillus ginsenosidimutans]|uniref:Uncharacterized protein n=1 Tax=Companilactobacillus ginsenosidimutans TaxID=1007676 RepID=A0A0H4QIJ7_9LACO|nr:hypothetical protein ABM34_09645 [Companilactobacillus ginsenosidimutans]